MFLLEKFINNNKQTFLMINLNSQNTRVFYDFSFFFEDRLKNLKYFLFQIKFASFLAWVLYG